MKQTTRSPTRLTNTHTKQQADIQTTTPKIESASSGTKKNEANRSSNGNGQAADPNDSSITLSGTHTHVAQYFRCLKCIIFNQGSTSKCHF